MIKWSMNYIEHCPTTPTKFGDDPWYLVTSKLTDKGEFRRNQNCQGSHAYLGVETLTRYYAYSGDEEAIKCVRLILDRVLYYHTPRGLGLAQRPPHPRQHPRRRIHRRLQRAGQDVRGGRGVHQVLQADRRGEVSEGGPRNRQDHRRPRGRRRCQDFAAAVPRRPSKDGKVLDPYTAHMVAPVPSFDEMIRLGEPGNGVYRAKRDLLWKWVLTYPVKNNRWSGFYEDVVQPNKDELRTSKAPWRPRGSCCGIRNWTRITAARARLAGLGQEPVRQDQATTAPRASASKTTASWK